MTKAKQTSPDAAPLGTSRATPLPTLLSVNAVAIELSVCTKTVRRLINAAFCPAAALAAWCASGLQI